jgi:hypothetical protein
MLHFIAHSLKSTIRAGFIRGGWGAKIILGILGFYLLGLVYLLGYFLPVLAQKAVTPEQDLVQVSAQFILYYLFADLAFRFIAQPMNGVELRHYVLLPVPYRKLIRFMLGRSLFNYFNLIALVVFVSYAFRALWPEMGILTALSWLAGLVFLMLGNSLLALYLKRVFAGNSLSGLIMLGVIVVLVLLEWLTNQTGMRISEKVFSMLLTSPLALIFLVYPFVTYNANFRYLLHNRYSERWQVSASEGGLWSRLEWQGKGRIAALAANEWKLIIRHKRSRTAVLFSLIFVAYGLVFYENTEVKQLMMVFAGIFITGFGAINYGQFLCAWEGRYFDGIFSRNLVIEDYYEAKFRLLSLLTGLSFTLSLLYGFISVKYIYLHLACTLFNVGFNNYILMFFSTYQRKPLDLNAGSAFNYQGTSALQFLIVFPLLIVPVLVYGLTDFIWGEMAGYMAVGGFGLVSMVFHRVWIKGIADNFKKDKLFAGRTYWLWQDRSSSPACIYYTCPPRA